MGLQVRGGVVRFCEPSPDPGQPSLAKANFVYVHRFNLLLAVREACVG